MKYIVDGKVIEGLKDTARGAEDEFDAAVNSGIEMAITRIEENSIVITEEDIDDLTDSRASLALCKSIECKRASNIVGRFVKKIKGEEK